MPAHADRPDGSDLDALTGCVAAELLRQSHLMRPGAVADALAQIGRPLGIRQARVYLADLQQQHLRPLSPGGGHGDELLIESTLAGRAYQTVTIQTAAVRNAGRPGEAEAGPAGTAASEAYQVWIPLVDGTERLGVLGLRVTDVGEPVLARYRTFASLVSMMVMAKSSYSDNYAQTQRSREMALQAELVWAFLAPRTFATKRVLVAASLEPAYEAGGDAFDYALLGDRLHVSIFDALGHDLSAGLLASVAMASCRSTRRAGGSLAAIAARADHAVARQFGDDRFVTALLCDLDLGTGVLSWIPCGHPPPLLLRGNRAVKELARPPHLPLG
ncbi:MAG: serine/threonine-protein phosphatase, partial [Actinobacteria bacterium]|nr:serine/threonine-protein phosphatase [Actinomycetota bacterium]